MSKIALAMLAFVLSASQTNAATVSWSPSNVYSLDFGSVAIGTTKTITMDFTAMAALELACPCNGEFYINNFEIETHGPASPFSLIGSDNTTLGHATTSPVTLSLSAIFAFSPNAVGNFSVSNDAIGNALVVDLIAEIGVSSPINQGGEIIDTRLYQQITLSGVGFEPNSPIQAPLPGSLLLFGTGMAALFARRRKRQN